MLTYPAGGLKVGLVFIYIHTLCMRAAKALVKFKKMHRLIGFVALAISEKSHVLTHTYLYISYINTLQVYLGQWTIPDTCICSTPAQKAELKVVGVLEVKQG